MSIRQWSGGNLGITAAQIAGVDHAMQEEITVDTRDASNIRSMTARAADLPNKVFPRSTDARSLDRRA